MVGVYRIITIMLGLLVSFGAMAALTPAGTVITNTVTLNYELEDGVTTSTSSNTAAFTVEELINVVLQWQDGSPVSVNSPDSADALTFRLTNTGNGVESFSINRNNDPTVSDDYNPITSAVPLYMETNGIPGLQVGAGGDTVVTDNITLNAEQSVLLYVLSDTSGGLPLTNTGQVALIATSTTAGAGGALPGTALTGLGDGGVDAIVGLTRAQAIANGVYKVGGLSLNVVKTVSVPGGGDPAPGTILVYTITVTLTGTGAANNLLITDPLPPELSYVISSITVDGNPRTDADDLPLDNAKFSGNTLTVSFGNTAAPVTHVITLSTTVK